MSCLNKINHTIQYGDSLYKLSKMYNTTVEQILADNPYLNPYNLQIGSTISICNNINQTPNIPEPNCQDTIPITPLSNMQPAPQHSNSQVNNMCCESKIDLLTRMNMLWSQHILWTRLFLISVAESLNDLEPTKARLLRNPVDIGNLYRQYYGDQIADRIKDLITEHLLIGGDIIVGLKNGMDVTELNKKWYENADEMAEFFSSINPHYDKETLRQMFHTHLDLTTKEVSARMKKDYAGDIIAYDNVEREILNMSRYLADGIIKQFPNMFSIN